MTTSLRCPRQGALPPPVTALTLCHTCVSMRQCTRTKTVFTSKHGVKAVVLDVSGMGCTSAKLSPKRAVIPRDAPSSPGGKASPAKQGATAKKIAFTFYIIADLDTAAVVQEGSTTVWRSFLRKVCALSHEVLLGAPLSLRVAASQGVLYRDESTGAYSLDLPTENIEIRTARNVGGRGFELSDLILWNGRLLTCDDRTGWVFEIVNYNPKKGASSADKPAAMERYELPPADASGKKMKAEWLAVKDNELYVGSNGQEAAGSGASSDYPNAYVTVIDPFGKYVSVSCSLITVRVMVLPCHVHSQDDTDELHRDVRRHP